MVNRKMILSISGVIIVAVAAWMFAVPGEDKKVKRQFSKLCSHLNKESNEGILDTAFKLRRTGALFAPKCTVTMSEAWLNGTTDGSTLVAQGFQGRMQFASMNLSFSAFKISFPAEDLARCETIAKLAGIGPAGMKVDESREMVWELRKIEGAWRFENISEVVVLKK